MVGEAVQEQLREFLCVPTYTDGRPMPNTRSNVTEIIQERHVDSWRIELGKCREGCEDVRMKGFTYDLNSSPLSTYNV